MPRKCMQGISERRDRDKTINKWDTFAWNRILCTRRPSQIRVKVLLCADNSVVLMVQILRSKVITLFIQLIKEIQKNNFTERMFITIFRKFDILYFQRPQNPLHIFMVHLIKSISNIILPYKSTSRMWSFPLVFPDQFYVCFHSPLCNLTTLSLINKKS